MVKRQQPELRRSDRGATSDDAAKPRLSAPNDPGSDGPGGRIVPEENAPGHHPDHEQDKPSGQDFVARTHALAESDDYEAPTPANEVLDLTPVEEDEVHDSHPPSTSPAEWVLWLAGKSLSLAGKSVNLGMKTVSTVIGQVRKRLPKH